MYYALDVARFVITYSNKKDGISNLKLQKILYMIQAYFLLYTQEPCFLEKIEAWDFGPVVPVVYKEFSMYGCCDIPTIWSDSDLVFLEEDAEKIRKVVDLFQHYTATDLVLITQNQAPWKDAYVPKLHNEITIEEIGKYFRKT